MPTSRSNSIGEDDIVTEIPAAVSVTQFAISFNSVTISKFQKQTNKQKVMLINQFRITHRNIQYHKQYKLQNCRFLYGHISQVSV